MPSPFLRGLSCRSCGKSFTPQATNFCTDCFGPLEVQYDYAAIRAEVSRADLKGRPFDMWRYQELLPLDAAPTVGLHVGGTPLLRADRLARELGVSRLWIKNDAVNHPTLSFKDRVVAVALSKAKEFGFQTVGCASTGNLANSVAANAAAAGLPAYILVPADLEAAKLLGTSIYGARLVRVRGTYDQVNRLCTQIAFKFGFGLVNINLRPFYAEGSKTFGYEMAEQLGWRLPQHVVVPMAGGSLIGKIAKAFRELTELGWVEPATTHFHGAQAAGCAPIATAVQSGAEQHRPVKEPQTIAKSLAIGDPADGFFAIQLIRSTRGWAEAVSDDEIRSAMQLLAETEGVFAETAGGVTLAATQRLIEQGRIGRDDEIVICITGNGLKTQEALTEVLEPAPVIAPKLEEFAALVAEEPLPTSA
ncbi:MAG TPA: threonine synthase [Gemmatales bacterium]|nr:threonine synthase [Gemmatales bacterium]